MWQLTQSLLLLTLIGCVTSWLYTAVVAAYERLRKRLTCSITLSSRDSLFKTVRGFLSESGLVRGSMSELKAQQVKKHMHWWQLWDTPADEQNKVRVEYLPGQGSHVFTYRGKKMWLSIWEAETLLTGWDNKPTKYENLTISMYGQDPALLRQLVREALEFAQEKDTTLVKIYQVHRWGGEWQLIQQKKPRSAESVVLDSDLARSVTEDIRKFLGSAHEYLSKGVPYRRGYLLFGPPGTGKTSFVQVVAAALRLDICYLNLAGGFLDDDGLNALLTVAPERAIILLEDVDAVFVERTSVQEQRGQAVTFSGLLNALDGVRSQEGRVLIMTTNHREKLDPALLRPGRADLCVELGLASER